MIENYKKKLQIALLFGGQSYEHEISLLSAIHVIKSIKNKYNLIPIGIDKQGKWIWFKNKKKYILFEKNVKKISLASSKHFLHFNFGKKHGKIIDSYTGKSLPTIDVVFSLLHGSYGENGSIQGMLNILDLPYVGSNVLSSAICMDKDITKKILKNKKISVVPSFTCIKQKRKSIPNYKEIIKKIGSPFLIKPTSQGSSIGISEINTQKEFFQALSLAFSYDEKILIEKKILGREIEIGLIKNKKLEVSVCGEILKKRKSFYSFEDKYIKPCNLHIPAKLNTFIEKHIQIIAKKIFYLLNCNSMARIDFFLTDSKKIIFNEINTLPGLSAKSMFTKLWEKSGVPFSRLLEKLITFAIKNHLKNKKTFNLKKDLK